MVIHDTECPYRDQVSLNNHETQTHDCSFFVAGNKSSRIQLAVHPLPSPMVASSLSAPSKRDPTAAHLPSHTNHYRHHKADPCSQVLPPALPLRPRAEYAVGVDGNVYTRAAIPDRDVRVDRLQQASTCHFHQAVQLCLHTQAIQGSTLREGIQGWSDREPKWAAVRNVPYLRTHDRLSWTMPSRAYTGTDHIS